MSMEIPTEFVVRLANGDASDDIELLLNMCGIENTGGVIGEQVVRCRDCGKWDAEGEPHAIHPERHWCDEFAHYVEPDGFCAWGEPRGDWVTCKCGQEIEAPSGWVVCPSCGRTVIAE